MSSPSEGIKDLLVAAGTGVFAATTGWGIYIGKMPDDPDTCITVYDSGGEPSDPKWLVDYPYVQVRVRANVAGYLTAEAKIKEVVSELLGLPSQDLNGDRWVSVTQISAPAFIGYDEKQRPEFTTNFRIIIEPATGTNRQSL